MDFIDQLPDPIAIASFLFLVGLAPFAVTMLTSFVKIAVVLFLVRTHPAWSVSAQTTT